MSARSAAAADMRPVLANAGYLIAGQAASGVCQFLRSAMIARYLGPSEYGLWGFAFAYVNLFAAVADFGLSTLAVRDMARGTEIGSYFGTVLRLKLALNLLLALGMVALEPLLNHDPQTRVLIYVMGAQMFLASLTLMVHTLFRARERMGIEARVNTAISFLSLVVAGGLVAAGAGVEALAASFLACSAAGLVVSVVFARRGYLPARLPWRPDLARSLLRDSWPICAGMVATAVYYFYDRVLMGVLGQQVEIGWYTAAYAPVLWLSGIITMLRAAFLPVQSRAFAGQDALRPILRYYGRVSFALGLPIAAAGLFLSRDLLSTVYGADYEAATFALKLLLLTVAAMFVSSFFGSNLLAAGLQRRYLCWVGVGAVANVALNSYMVPLWSLDGAALATLLSEALVAVLMARECGRWLSFGDIRHMAAKPLAATTVMAAVLELTSTVAALPMTIALSVVAYAISIWWLRLLQAPPEVAPGPQQERSVA